MAPSHRGDLFAIGRDLIGATLDVIGAEGGGRVDWWVFEPTPDARRARGRDRLATGTSTQPDAPATADRGTIHYRDPAVRARCRRGRVAGGQQPGVRGASRARRLGSRHAGAPGTRAVVRSGRVPPPRARRAPRRLLLDEAPHRSRSGARRDLRDRRRSRLPGPRSRQATHARRPRLDRRTRRVDRHALRRRRQHGWRAPVRPAGVHRPPHRPRLRRRDRALRRRTGTSQRGGGR